jgi:hypothetical protein
MADHHEIVEQIRAFLQASDQTRNERLEGLASAFAEACVGVNQRLGRCQRLLQQGLRSEAIQLAESEPRLLDAATSLDFPERAEWDELVAIYSMTEPPRLSSEARTALLDAYAEAEPLEHLLRSHRRLATQRAPLRSRIAVMRKLMALDVRNPIWADDLRPFEQARLRQIQIEAAEAVRLQDSAHISRLLSELHDPAWLEPLPKALAHGLTRAEAQIREEQTQAKQAEIEARLAGALANKDPVLGRAARDEWNALLATAPPEPGDPCSERVGRALKWLDEEDRQAIATQAYESAMATLSSALDDRRPISAADLERLERDVLRHGRGMPEKLQRRYATRFRSAAAKRSRRIQLIAAAATASFLLAGGLAFYVFQGMLRNRDAEQAAATITGLIDNGDFNQADGFLSDLEKADPGLLSYPALIKVRERSKSARDRETERARKFREALEAAKTAAIDEVEPRALATARSLARVEAEKLAVEQLARQREAARTDANSKRETNLRPRLETIAREIDQLGTRLAQSPLDQDRFQEELDSSRQSLNDLAASVTLSGQAIQGLAAEAKQKLDDVSNRFERLRRRTLLRDDLTSAVAYSVTEQSDSLGLFASRLRNYVKAFPDEPCSHAFETVLDERPFWDSIAAWNALVTRWQKERGELAPEQAQERAKSCSEFLEKNPRFPGIEEVQAYRRYAQAIARRASRADSPAGTIRKLCANRLLDQVWMIVSRTGKTEEAESRYYTRKEPSVHGDLLHFSCIINKGDSERPRTFVLADVVSRDLSPQSRVIDRFRAILADKAKLERWESAALEMIAAIVDERSLDPVLQAAMLKSVVNAAGEGSEPLRVALEPIKQQLDQSSVDLKVDWTDPEAPHLAESRSGARELVDRLRPRVAPLNQVMHIRDALELTIDRTYRAMGWLVRAGNGYTVKTGAALPADGELRVIATSAGKRGEWKTVGAIAGGKVLLRTSDQSALVEGRPVFGIDRNQ